MVSAIVLLIVMISRFIEDDKCLGCVGKILLYSRIFRPITTARLQVVAEKSGMYSWGDNKFTGMQQMCGWEHG